MRVVACSFIVCRTLFRVRAQVSRFVFFLGFFGSWVSGPLVVPLWSVVCSVCRVFVIRKSSSCVKLVNENGIHCICVGQCLSCVFMLTFCFQSCVLCGAYERSFTCSWTDGVVCGVLSVSSPLFCVCRLMFSAVHPKNKSETC